MPTFREDLHLGRKVPLVEMDDISRGAITSEKIADGAVEWKNISEDVKKMFSSIESGGIALSGQFGDSEFLGITQKKLTEEFKKLIDGMDELQDAVFPIVLTLSVAYSNKRHTVSFTVKEKGADFIGDTLTLVRTLANGTSETITDVPAASGSYSLDVKSNREIFRLDVTKAGRASKSASATRYICYAGASASAEINESIVNGFTMYSSANVAFNPSVGTANGQYIWLVVPSYLTINKVTSGGFDVALETAKTVSTALGTFKAYRTANTLTAQTWDLVIS